MPYPIPEMEGENCGEKKERENKGYKGVEKEYSNAAAFGAQYRSYQEFRKQCCSPQ
jgi:hypothetical protein